MPMRQLHGHLGLYKLLTKAYSSAIEGGVTDVNLCENGRDLHLEPEDAIRNISRTA
jgi:hypothetical protein